MYIHLTLQEERFIILLTICIVKSIYFCTVKMKQEY
nr:MAG TPA: hypothetical protein [Caudoviricetes sp.]DAR57130.1 MAG TPA: hypothetical protein [Caudoviricetes sp.]